MTEENQSDFHNLYEVTKKTDRKCRQPALANGVCLMFGGWLTTSQAWLQKSQPCQIQ